MNLLRISCRIATVIDPLIWSNSLDQTLMDRINDDLLYAYGASAIDEVLQSYGLKIKSEIKGNVYSIGYIDLGSLLLRNAYLQINEDSRGKIKFRSIPRKLTLQEKNLIQSRLEKKYGPFSFDPED